MKSTSKKKERTQNRKRVVRINENHTRLHCEFQGFEKLNS
jgi:hypothetical protein